MPQLNKEKLDQMVEAVMNEMYLYIDYDNNSSDSVRQDIQTALTPFCMEMTDKEIEEVAAIRFGGKIDPYEWGKKYGFFIGAKFIRDGK